MWSRTALFHFPPFSSASVIPGSAWADYPEAKPRDSHKQLHKSTTGAAHRAQRTRDTADQHITCSWEIWTSHFAHLTLQNKTEEEFVLVKSFVAVLEFRVRELWCFWRCSLCQNRSVRSCVLSFIFLIQTCEICRDVFALDTHTSRAGVGRILGD